MTFQESLESDDFSFSRLMASRSSVTSAVGVALPRNGAPTSSIIDRWYRIIARSKSGPGRLIDFICVCTSPAQCEDEREQDAKADAVNKHSKKHACSKNILCSVVNIT